jgi:hypothetical protein
MVKVFFPFFALVGSTSAVFMVQIHFVDEFTLRYLAGPLGETCQV